MAKLIGPLLSFGARGSIGKTMVTANWRGIKYARQYVIPANPRTDPQKEVRNVFAMLNGYWLVSPPSARAPWEANAVGQKYLGRNKLLSENVKPLLNQADMDDFIASPGAKGGLPLDGMTAATGAASGTIAVTATAPAPPTGWVLTKVIWVAFPDQDASAAFEGPITAVEDLESPYAQTITGLTPGDEYQVAAWPVWTRPDNSLAYGPALITQAIAKTP